MSQAQWTKIHVGICLIWLSPKQIVSIGFGAWLQTCDCKRLKICPVNNVWLDMIFYNYVTSIVHIKSLIRTVNAILLKKSGKLWASLKH